MKLIEKQLGRTDIYKGRIIGGDVTSTAADGAVQGFKSPA